MDADERIHRRDAGRGVYRKELEGRRRASTTCKRSSQPWRSYVICAREWLDREIKAELLYHAREEDMFTVKIGGGNCISLAG
jgi:hypothetical protein